MLLAKGTRSVKSFCPLLSKDLLAIGFKLETSLISRPRHCLSQETASALKPGPFVKKYVIASGLDPKSISAINSVIRLLRLCTSMAESIYGHFNKYWGMRVLLQLKSIPILTNIYYNLQIIQTRLQ